MDGLNIVGDGLAITINPTPDTGYYFVQWTINSSITQFRQPIDDHSAGGLKHCGDFCSSYNPPTDISLSNSTVAENSVVAPS